MKKLLFLTLVILLSACLLTSCKKDKGDPPVLPPQESMIIDFSNFGTQKKAEALISDNKGTEDSNWEFAAVVAGIWKNLITTTLAVPVATFNKAIDQDPVYLEEKTWQWSFDITVLNVAYKARLTGLIRATDVLWKMYVSSEGKSEFVWFEGTSKLDGTGGQWILNQSSQVPEAMLQIDWTKTGNSIGSVKYTYVKNGDAFKTSYIEYGLKSATLNAYYTIHYYNSSSLKFSDVYVEWSTANKNGKVKSIDYLGDDKWYCWNENKINVICPL